MIVVSRVGIGEAVLFGGSANAQRLPVFHYNQLGKSFLDVVTTFESGVALLSGLVKPFS